jgi:hypothetical protein
MTLYYDSTSIDEHLKTTLKSYADDYSGQDIHFFRFFSRYVKENIFGAVATDELFMAEEEKSLAYIRKDAIESPIEYEISAAQQDFPAQRHAYIEKGANHCMMLSVLQDEPEKNYLRKRAQVFYRQATRTTLSALYEHLFGFLAEAAPVVGVSLENYIAGYDNIVYPRIPFAGESKKSDENGAKSTLHLIDPDTE